MSTTNSPAIIPSPLTRSQQTHAVMAGFMGWTMDAFDFFVLVFMMDQLAANFHVSKAEIISTIMYTLAMRPVGALLFGVLADRYGRRGPLMANVIFFSVIELLCGFAPNFAVFVVLRTVYGIGMGGEWGVGASLAMESAPQKWRGVLSGVLQSGYSVGYLLAAIAARFVLPVWGWRPMFWLGGIPALLAFYIRWHVKESEAWRQHRVGSVGKIMKVVFQNWKLFAYLAVMMTLMMCLSHGTQDLYPDFLKSAHHAGPAMLSLIVAMMNVGAVVGAILFGFWSEKIGRRKALVAALILSLVTIPAWAFGAKLLIVGIAAFVMQVGVQGAWGIIPAHLNELSPGAVRGLIPGLAYQLGILFAAPTPKVEYVLQARFGYGWALAGFEIATIVLLAVIVMLGKEEHGKEFLRV